MRSIARLLIPVLSVVLAACTAGQGPTPIPATPIPTTPTVSATDSTTTGASQPPVAGADGVSSSAPVASVRPSSQAASLAETMTADPELEATIPHAVGDVQLEIFSLNGKEYLARSADVALRQMIGETPLEPVEVSIALGVGRLEGKQLAIAAFRFPDVPETRLRALFREELLMEIPGGDVHDATIGGHGVQVIDDPSDASMPTYLIVEGDTARVVQASADDLAKAAVGQMP